MLLIQHINLYWDKECRGAPYSGIRNAMAAAYDLPHDFVELNCSLGYPLHSIYLRQDKSGLAELSNRKTTTKGHEKIRVGALRILRVENGYEVRYCYEYHRAMPERHKYNPVISRYVELDETAMFLAANEYGRIIYNGRYTDMDTGAWYYNIDIINIVEVEIQKGCKIPVGIFGAKVPDKTYNQVEHLY